MKKIIQLKVLRVLSIAICLISCRTDKEVSNLLPVTYEDSYLHSSSISSNIECIKLATDTVDAIVSQISRILLSPDNLYIVDRVNNKIVAFDRSGKYVTSTSPLLGRARNEYIRINDAAIDTIQHRIYAYCDAPYQIMILDYNLNCVECIAVNELIMECSIDERNFYALCLNIEDESLYELRCYDKYNLTKGYDVLLKQDKGIAYVRSLGKSLIGDMKKTYVCMPFDNRIYSISNGTIKETWGIDWGDKWFNYDTSGQLKGTHFLKANEGINWFMQNICASDTTMYFNTNRSGINKMDLKRQKVINYIDVDNPNIPFSSSWMVPTSGACNTMVYSIPASVVGEYADYYRSRNLLIPTSDIRDIIEQTAETDNPILFIGTIQ